MAAITGKNPFSGTRSTAALSTKPYILGPGESAQTVAKRYNLTFEELEKLNFDRSFAKPFKTLGVGDEITVPYSLSPMGAHPLLPPSSEKQTKLAEGVHTAGALLSESNIGAAADLARSTAVNHAGQSGEQWLNQFGAARIQLNTDRDFKFTNSAADLLISLKETERSTLFSQWGIRNNDKRNTLNIGLGARTEYHGWLYGANTFYDYDISGKNRRLGVGAEAWTDYLRLSGNTYFGLTDWHQSRDFADYDERPASGFDIRTQGWLPYHPQLGGTLMYERYRGDSVALFGKDNRQKDPYALTAGINYTPVPLVTVGAEHRAGKGGANDSRLNFQLNYRLGDSWRSQLDPSLVGPSRTLSGSRHDLVDRNYNIVLDYQRREVIRLTMPAQLTAEARASVTLSAEVTAEHGLDRIEWDAASLTALGGGITKASPRAVTLVMPAWQDAPGAANTYNINAIAFDSKGNASKRAITKVIVAAPEIIALASLTIEGDGAVADGITPIRILAKVIDGDGNGVADKTVVFSADNGATVLIPSAVSDATGVAATNITTRAPGPVTVRASVDNARQQATITFIPDAAAETQAVIEMLTAGNKRANTIDAHQVKVTVRDTEGNTLRGKTVSFSAENSAVVTPIGGDITDVDGVLIANVTSRLAGEETVRATVEGYTTSGVNMAFIADVAAEATTVIEVLTSGDKIVGAGDGHRVRVTVRDANNNPVGGQRVNFGAPSAGVAFSLRGGDTAPDGTIETIVTSTEVGRVVAYAKLAGFAKTSEGMNFIEAAVDGARSTLDITPDTIQADNITQAIITFNARDALDNVLTGRHISFVITDLANTTVSAVTETGTGVYSATLTARTPGQAKVNVQAEGVTVTGISGSIEVQALPIITAITINGHSFNTTQRVPSTGFAGANFSIIIDGDAANNANYNWASSTSAVSVSSTGLVTLLSPPAGGGVTITAEDKTNPARKTATTFTITKWFTNNGGTKLSQGDAEAYCIGLAEGYKLPQYYDAIGLGSQGTRQRGSLWQEWGRMSTYGWETSNYWTRDLAYIFYKTNLETGFQSTDSSTLNNVICSRVL